MKQKNPSVYQPLPTIEQLMSWSTPRLLRFFKAKRRLVYRDYYYDDLTPEDKAMAEYLDQIRSELNTREHVST